MDVVSTSASASDKWTGTWDTRWHDGGARLELQQDGEKITGQYPSWGGTVEGMVSGRVFEGHWHRGDLSGGFDFVQASDGKSFVGRYASGEWWTGTRVSADANDAEPIDLSSPRATLRTFVRGGNAARYDAPDELVRSASALDFGSQPPQPVVRLARAKTLFDILDTTFFRLYDVPDKVSGDTLTVTLGQLGSDAKLPLNMAKHGDRRLGRQAALDQPGRRRLPAGPHRPRDRPQRRDPRRGRRLVQTPGGASPPSEPHRTAHSSSSSRSRRRATRCRSSSRKRTAGRPRSKPCTGRISAGPML